MLVRATQSLVSRRLLLVGGVATTALALASCDNAEAPVDEQGRVRIRFATDGLAQPDHGGFYQALATGAYERRGLNVQIIPGGPDVDVPQLLASGAVELGLASSSLTPLGLVAGGAPVKAVAAFFQKDPLVLMTHPDPALTTIADLTGRPFALTEASVATLWPWLRATYGFTDDQLVAYAADPAGFIADDEAVRQGRLTLDPYAIQTAADFEPGVFLPADEGYASYGGLVLSPTGFARDNAEALRSFIAASAEGWRDYVRGDPAPAEALIKAANRAMTQAILDQGRTRLSANGMIDSGDAALYGLGAMTAERWQAFFEAMSQAGVYSANLRWRDAFTVDFLPGRG